MKIKRVICSAILCLLAAIPQPKAADNNREETVLAFERAWAKCWTTRDFTKEREMLTDDFVDIDPSGEIKDKADHLKELESRKLVVNSVEFKEMKVRFYGDIAVVTGTLAVKATYDGDDISGDYAATDVLLFRDGKWKAVSTQATKIDSRKLPSR